MSAETERQSLAAAGDAGDEIAAAAAGQRCAGVLKDVEAEVAEVPLDHIGDLPLGSGRRRDAGELDEEVEEFVV